MKIVLIIFFLGFNGDRTVKIEYYDDPVKCEQERQKYVSDLLRRPATIASCEEAAQ